MKEIFKNCTKIEQLKRVLLKSETFHEIELNGFKIMVYCVIIWISGYLLKTGEHFNNNRDLKKKNLQPTYPILIQCFRQYNN